MGAVFLALTRVDAFERPIAFLREKVSVLLHALGLFEHEALEVLVQDVVAVEEGLHGPAGWKGEVTFQEDSVKAFQHAHDLVLVLFDKSFHGVLRSWLIDT